MRVGLLVSDSVLLFSVLLGTVSSADETSGDIRWYSIVTDSGLHVGHSSHEVAKVSGGTEIIDTQEIDVEEEGTPAEIMSFSTPPKVNELSWRTVLQEDEAGQVVAIHSTSQIGREISRIDATIANGRAEITRQTSAETRHISVVLPNGIVFDSGNTLLESWNPSATPKLELDDFDVDAMAVRHVTIEAVRGGTPDQQGRIEAIRESYDGDSLREITRLLLDRDGHVVDVLQPMYGTSLTTRSSDRETALGSQWAFRPLKSSMMKSPFRISSPAMEGHIRYRFSFRDGIEFPLPQTGEQRVVAEPGSATVDICDACGSGLPSDAATLADALKPTAWLQSDSPKLKAIADPVAALQISDAQKMEMLREKAKPYLGRVVFTGHYSALETMARHASDCSDAAVLLAALGRAAGIPTKVATGLVYSRESYHGVSNVFLPHAWTLAFVDGRWRSFDLALDKFDATHVALSIGDGDERSGLAAGEFAGLLKWDGMAEVRVSPAN